MIEIHQVSHRYPNSDGRPPALASVSLRVEDGEFVAVLGHNGSGKSTLAKLMNGLLIPASGRVSVDGMDTRNPASLWEIRRRVGMIFQNPDNQIVGARVEEDVAFGPENLGLPREQIRLRVEAALRAVGMEAYASAEPHRLSGGQKQRVAIAGILALDPPHLVLDEATAMLDPAGRREVLETLSRLHRQGRAVALITHYVEEALLADRVVVLSQGRVAAEGPPRDIFAQGGLLRDLKLDLPPMRIIAEALERRGVCLNGDPLTVSEMVEALCALS